LNPFSQLRGISGTQWRAFLAAYLGWTLDAFDFFLLIMVVRHIAADFHTGIPSVSYAIFLTLATRPVGALLFGLMADRYGRRPALMASILLYAAVELLSAFAPSLAVLLVLRAAFGIGMGGVWGVGASLAMESVPPRSRGAIAREASPTPARSSRKTPNAVTTVTVTVTLTLTFAPDSGADDPTIQFSSGGRTAHITVPAGATNGATDVGVQTGSALDARLLATELTDVVTRPLCGLVTCVTLNSR